jgi:hypothetical protein
MEAVQFSSILCVGITPQTRSWMTQGYSTIPLHVALHYQESPFKPLKKESFVNIKPYFAL